MTGAKNEEFIKFRNNILIVLAVTLICIAFVILLFGKGINSGPINKKIKNKETFLIYITSSDCDKCSEVRDFLDEKNVTYEEIYETSSQAKKIFKEYNFVLDGTVAPAIVFVYKGKIYSNFVNIKDTEELSEFVDHYKLSK
ncbi:MAG: hypothetical protein Q4E69_01285 [Bacilli bacterium]|nr:hypothetical protein [Bacilli bacterium]